MTTHLTNCVACDTDNLELILDLNKQPLANSYKLNKQDVQEEYPLAINLCKNCFHVQLTHAVDPSLMFEDYLYVSGTTVTGRQHFKEFAEMAVSLHKNANNVLDIGCNDGTQLDYFKELGLETYGIDPAKNLLERSSKNHTVMCDYFNNSTVESLNQEFDIIVAQNVFAHTANPYEFLINVSNIMNNDSLLFIQTSQANMILNNEFDTIYHEHISFFCVNSMNELCKRAGLNLIKVDYASIHGTSFIFVISKNEKTDTYNIPDAIRGEDMVGLYSIETYYNYAEKCNSVVKELKIFVDMYRNKMFNWNVIGYGAAAKGMTLLNYANIELDYIVDDNPLKQGRYTPGSSIAIYSSNELTKINKPVLVVPLAWNFFTEIKASVKKLRPNIEDRFCTYFPNVEIQK